MEQLILWFNIMGFTLLFASLGAAYVVYGRIKPRWLTTYLLYLAVYAFFTIFNTYDFFSQVYLPSSSSFFASLARYLTFIIALSLLVIVPRLIFILLSPQLSLGKKVFPFLMAGLFLVMMIFAMIFPSAQLDSLGSIFMNGYLGLVTLYGLIKLRSNKERVYFGVVIPFLYISCIFYFIVVVQSLLLPMFTSPILNLHLSLFTAGLICFLCGAITLGYLIVKNLHQENLSSAVVSEDFAYRFGITPREKEIVNLLLHGKSNKEIGEVLFVSPRTVETHVYNIYRKCSVKNKLELARQISTSP